MKLGILISIATLSLSAKATTTCPDLSGKWLGICKVEQSNLPATMAKFQTFAQQMANEIEIVQVGAANPLTCGLLTISGVPVAINGLHSQSLSVPMDDGQTLSVSANSSGYWDTANNGLVVKSSGLLQVGNFSFPYGLGEFYGVNAAGKLVRRSVMKGQNYSAEVECTYQRH